MKGNKKEVAGPVAFIKSDKSRIIEVSEDKDGKFELVGVYHRIELTALPLGAFAPKERKFVPNAKDSDDEDRDPLTKGFNMTSEEVHQIALLIEGGATRPIDICKEVGCSMPTFMKVFARLKELGKIHADARAGKLGKTEE